MKICYEEECADSDLCGFEHESLAKKTQLLKWLVLLGSRDKKW